MAAGPGPSGVDEAEPEALPLDHEAGRELRLELRLVHVPVHGGDRRTEHAQLRKRARGDDVTDVEHERGVSQELDATRWETTCAARQVRVAEERYHDRPSSGDAERCIYEPGPSRKRPFS
jgi:hypothetical protein